MGNQESQPIQGHKEHEIDSPHFMLSNCKLILTQKNRLLKSSWSFVDKKVYQSWKSRLAKHLQKLFKTQNYEQIIKHPIYNFIFIPEYHEYVQIGYCSTNGAVNMVYEMIDESLVRNIELRSLKNQPFTQNEVWIILYILTKTADYFHSSNQAVGDIRPENIFISQNEKFVKLATQYSWIYEKSLKNKWINKEKIFLSEAMIKCLAEKESSFSKIEFNNDSFAIGMTLAECVLLQDLSKIYDASDNQLTINRQKHMSIIQNLLKIKYYPINLLIIIIGMIQLQQSNRFTCEQVSKCLDEFRLEILTENAIIINRSHFKRYFGSKFDQLYTVFSHYKSNINKKLFINRELSLSNAYTINGISTVQMKRTYDETFNIEMLDFSTSLAPMPHKASQADDNNKSWNSTGQKLLTFFDKNKRSNVLDQYDLSSDRKVVKSNQKSNKKSERIRKLSPIVIQSDVELFVSTPERQKHKINASPNPVTNYNSNSETKQGLYTSLQLKILETKKVNNEQIFSFHQPQTHILQVPISRLENMHKKCYQSHEILHLSPEAAQSIIIANRQSERPQSYITYEYSKSKLNSHEKELLLQSPKSEYFNFTNDIQLRKLKQTCEITTDVERGPYDALKRKSLEMERLPYENYLRD